MNELALHIKVLLLSHSHVALPQFGTFFTETEQAGFVGDDVFAPVRRNVYFSPDIDDADNTLIESFMHTYNLNREVAERKLNTLLADASNSLACTGTLDFDTLGVFTFSGGHITFSACKASFVVPEQYGLDAFSMPLLPKLASEAQGNSPATKTSHDNNYVIRVNRQLVHYAASIAAAVLLFFVFNTPLGEIGIIDKVSPSLSGMFIPHINQSITTGDYILTESSEKTSDSSIFEPDATTNDNEDTTKQDLNIIESDEKPSPTISNNTYTVVLASNVSIAGAEYFVEQLKKSGYDEAYVHKSGNMIRVVYSLFETEAQAYAAAHALKCKDADFCEAWVMKIAS